MNPKKLYQILDVDQEHQVISVVRESARALIVTLEKNAPAEPALIRGNQITLRYSYDSDGIGRTAYRVAVKIPGEDEYASFYTGSIDPPDVQAWRELFHKLTDLAFTEKDSARALARATAEAFFQGGDK